MALPSSYNASGVEKKLGDKQVADANTEKKRLKYRLPPGWKKKKSRRTG